jgi:outer membrane cobalamin receptor
MKIPCKIVCMTLLFTVFIFLRQGIYGQVQGAVKGQILDEQTGKPLAGANVMIKNTLSGAATDLEGLFSIQGLYPGNYTLIVSMMGYERKNIAVSVQSNSTGNVILKLTPTVLVQPTLIITATKRRQLIEDAPTTVELVQADDIIRRNPRTLDEVLVNTTGLGIIDGQLELRGSTGFNWAAGSRVLLMIDGHPMINGDTGGINWDAVPVEDVKSVEIVKGAGSALYGSNAMSGVINVITKSPSSHPDMRYRLSWGFYDEPAYSTWRWTDDFLTYRISKLHDWDPRGTLSYESADVSYGQQIRNTDIMLSLGRKKSNGYQQNGDFSRWNGMLKTAVHFSPQAKWTLLANFAVDDHGEFIQWQSQSSPMTVPDEELGNQIIYYKSSLLSTFSNAINQRLAYSVKTSWYRTDWENTFPGMRDFAVTDRFSTEIQVDTVITDRHSCTFGAEGIYTTTKALIFGNRKSRDEAVYAEDEFKFSPLWTLTAGMRLDMHQIPNVSANWQVSPRTGLVFRPAVATSVRMSAGYGFRAPSLAEVFSTVNVAGVRVVPNYELNKAERAVSTEIGINQMIQIPHNAAEKLPGWLRPTMMADIALFGSQYENMIDVRYNDDLRAYQFINLGEAFIGGVEFKIKTSLLNGHLTAHCGVTELYHEDKVTKKPLPYRSNHRVTTGGVFTAGLFVLGFDYRYSSRQKEVVSLFEDDERVPMHVCDAWIQTNFGKYSLIVDGKNIFNYNYTLRQRLLEPIRHYTITLRGKL